MPPILILIPILLTLAPLVSPNPCLPCFYSERNLNCQPQQNPFILHMSVHPHLDAFWIYDFDTYYQLQSQDAYEDANGYFQSNNFSPVKQIFDSALQVLTKSKRYREQVGSQPQKSHRTFFNSQIGFFKHWYTHLHEQKKQMVKQLLKSGYWEIVGGGWVQHDEGCAHYEDIIENFELGLHFLKERLDYTPKIAISADSFGHSQSTAAILAHLGIEGFFVQRSDEHILRQNKTQFIWKAKSYSNNLTYGTMPTHIRWAIHGYEDQFTYTNQQQIPFCQEKQQYIGNLRKQNKFLRQIIKSDHVMRYFGHDFQKFEEYQYEVLEAFMEQFSREKCENVVARYTNPTEYFKIYLSEVIGKQKNVAYREEDIMPIWDYDSGLYWTGYYTTDPYHKKIYRDCGRFLHAVRKAFALSYIQDPKTNQNMDSYQTLEKFAEVVAYLQHHDGISGTSKYIIMDQYETKAQKLSKELTTKILSQIFQIFYPVHTNNPILDCGIFRQCLIPQNVTGSLLVKIFNSGGKLQTEPVVIKLGDGQYYEADCQFEIVCMCVGGPCGCDLYLYPDVFTFTEVMLTKVEEPKNLYFLNQVKNSNPLFSYNRTHLKLKTDHGPIQLGYKSVLAEATNRQYEHLSRYGYKSPRGLNINSGKYALGNNPSTASDLSTIRKVYHVRTGKMDKILVLWARQQMKTIIETCHAVKGSYKVTTLSSAKTGTLSDMYIEFGSGIQNNKKFYTDSNGWLVMRRQLYKHQDYEAFFSPDDMDAINGNTYPMASFSYIEDSLFRLVVNTDRPQGVISLREGSLWVNFDRLTSDDGKWVYETTYRSQYQKFVHYVTLHNFANGIKNNAARTIQQLHDQPLLIQVSQLQSNLKYEHVPKSTKQRNKWAQLAGIENTKFWIRPWNDSTVTLRIQNIYDDTSVKVGLFNGKMSPFLSAYYGNGVYFQSLRETSLGSNMGYEEFLRNKWNLNTVADVRKQNQIFNKLFNETIQLRPLEIRTFVIKGMSNQKCPQLDQLGLKETKIEYKQDYNKPFPFRSQENVKMEKLLVSFLKNQDHCEGVSPVRAPKLPKPIDYTSIDMILRNPDQQIQVKKRPYTEQLMSQDDPYKNKHDLYQPTENLKSLPYTYTPQKKPQQKQPQQQKPKEQAIPLLLTPKNQQQMNKISEKIKKYGILTRNQKEMYFIYRKKKIQQLMSSQK